MMFTHKLVVLTIGTACLVLSGCGSSDGLPEPAGPKASVKGKLTYAGKPVTTGTLLLDSGKGFAVAAPVNPDGTFELKGTKGTEFPAGTYTVGISPPNPTTTPVAGGMAPRPIIEGIPVKFYTASTSGVKVEVAAGKQDLNIDLK